MYPELYKCNSWESTFVEFCVDGINLFDENNFIDSLGPGGIRTQTLWHWSRVSVPLRHRPSLKKITFDWFNVKFLFKFQTPRSLVDSIGDWHKMVRKTAKNLSQQTDLNCHDIQKKNIHNFNDLYSSKNFFWLMIFIWQKM